MEHIVYQRQTSAAIGLNGKLHLYLFQPIQNIM